VFGGCKEKPFQNDNSRFGIPHLIAREKRTRSRKMADEEPPQNEGTPSQGGGSSPALGPVGLALLEQVEKDLEEAEGKVKQFYEHVNQASREQGAVKKVSLRLLKDYPQAVKGLSKEQRKEYEERLSGVQQRIEALKGVLPETRSFFSRLLLGRVNLKVWTSQERDRLRDEYHKFKFRTNLIFIALPVMVLFSHYYLRFVWKDTHWMNILHQLWLLYYYASLALRENILLVNGSNVRPWWIYHHYVAAFGSVMLITWPDTPTYARIAPYWQFFLLYQGFVQVLQLWYQKRRDYANRALGRTQRMDVSYSETLTEFPKELVLLVPFVLFAHMWQMSLGIYLLNILFNEMDPLNTHWTAYTEEVQCALCGFVAMLLGIGNIVTTVKTLWSKSQKTGAQCQPRKAKKKDE